MASNGPLESCVKVAENRDGSDDCSNSTSETDTGENMKRRRITHDYKKLAKLGYIPSVSNFQKTPLTQDSKGKKLL